ncbi:peptide chain release factor N(5)-glutamine methyltransferase [soil metagenome]
MKQIDELLADAVKTLADAGVEEPRREAASLMASAIGRDAAFLIAHPEYKLSAEEAATFASFVERRSAREPFHYIVGNKEFYGLSFIVGPSVLIPRPETEILVTSAIEVDPKTICEIGVGSGCISIAILKALPDAKAVGLEISGEAIKVARANARRHGVTERFELRESDVFSALGDESFDLIVSNPPYVPANEIASLQPEVRDFEPHLALTDGSIGLGIISRLVHQAPKHLSAGGWLMFEMGVDQDVEIRKMMDPAVWHEMSIVPDLAGIPRVARARSIARSD